ncbi:MAG TPA: hypothetical protein VJ816_06345 [Gemmatimonadales bacterium]|nr:hypothetical protein [Gemmatimonadales bacterium]
MLPQIYQVYWRGDPSEVAEFSSWYMGKHAAELIDDVGFWGVHHYRSLHGRAQASNIYEIPGIELFTRRSYDQIHQDDEYTAHGHWGSQQEQNQAKDLRGAPGSRQTIYDVIASIGIIDHTKGEPARPVMEGAIVSPVVSTIRFGAASDKAVIAWYEEAETERLLKIEGFVKSRLGRRAAQQHPEPTHPHEERAYVVITEWTHHGAAAAEGDEHALTERLAAALDLEGELEVDVFRQQMSLLHPDVWR